MEHELFQTELKPLADGASLSKVINGSSLGEHPHRATVMQLIIERSIGERRKRMATKVEDTPQSDPETDGGMTIIPTQQAENPGPVPQPSSSTSGSVSTTFAKEESPKSSTPTPEDNVRLVCGGCIGGLGWYTRFYCLSCPRELRKEVKCSGCGSIWQIGNSARACAHCHKMFTFSKSRN